MFLDFSADYLCWDNTSAVIVEVARAVPPIVDVPPVYNGQAAAPVPQPSRNKRIGIPVAKRRNLTMRELAASGGVYTSDDQVYLLPDALFPPGSEPTKSGDVIIETQDLSAEARPGTRWTVLEVGWGKNRQTRRLTCRNLVLAYDLRDTIIIERPAVSYDKAGVPVKSFPSDASAPAGVTLYASLPARVQLVTKDIAEQRGIRDLEGKYRVIVGQEVDVTQQDRVLLSSGMYLDIVSYENAQRIDELPAIVCERRV